MATNDATPLLASTTKRAWPRRAAALAVVAILVLGAVMHIGGPAKRDASMTRLMDVDRTNICDADGKKCSSCTGTWVCEEYWTLTDGKYKHHGPKSFFDSDADGKSVSDGAYCSDGATGSDVKPYCCWDGCWVVAEVEGSCEGWKGSKKASWFCLFL